MKMAKIATSLASRITLNDGVQMPLFGLGVYKAQNNGEAYNSVKFALANGYRMIDTAAYYGNEEDCGRAIRDSGLKRDDVFIVTKLLPQDHGAKKCQEAFALSLKRLDLDYIDLYLIHSPSGGKILETYSALLELKKKGVVRSVGVSNFSHHQIESLRNDKKPLPSVNQIELHPFLKQQFVVEYCEKAGIALMGYCPIVRGHKMNDPLFVQFASKYSKSVAQVMIRWSVQKGFITIPKSVHNERILENSKVFDFEILPEDMEKVEKLPDHIVVCRC